MTDNFEEQIANLLRSRGFLVLSPDKANILQNEIKKPAIKVTILEEKKRITNPRINPNAPVQNLNEEFSDDNKGVILTNKQQKALLAIKNGKEWAGEIGEAANIEVIHIYNILKLLERRLLVEKVARGKYKLTEKGKEVVA